MRYDIAMAVACTAFLFSVGIAGREVYRYYNSSKVQVTIALGPCSWERRFVIPCTDCATHGPQLGSVQ
jgi:hypothetical protein